MRRDFAMIANLRNTGSLSYIYLTSK
jgi:hypothetical protein